MIHVGGLASQNTTAESKQICCMYFAYRPLQKPSAAARVDKGSTVGTGRMFGCFTTGLFVSLAVSYYSPGKKLNKKKS